MIPRERTAILIGKNGKTKEFLERETGTKISITEVVEISGNSLGVLKACMIIKAIGRGFSPHKAFLLLKDEYDFDMISLEGETENTTKRLMGRIIGKGGKARKKIEKETGCFISVYGKTVSLIGKSGDLNSATRAVERLLSGKSHGYAYSALK